MDRRLFLSSVAAGSFALPHLATAQDKKRDKTIDAAVERGLDALKKQQSQDGHWESPGGAYPTCVTAIGGMAMLMEGSNLREGMYTDPITKAVNWFLAPARLQATGLLGNFNNPTEQSRYTYGHGFGTMFLSSVYGEEEDREQRKKQVFGKRREVASRATNGSMTSDPNRYGYTGDH